MGLKVTAALLSTGFLVGCGTARLPGLSRAGAPVLREDSGFRNAANPNAPYASPLGQPKLLERPAVLDVNGVPPCDPASLSLYESEARSNGAHRLVRLTLANSGQACRLGGFPAVTLLGSDGSVLSTMRLEKVSASGISATLEPAAQAADETEQAPSPQVLLPPNGGASFALGWTAGEACAEVARIAVGAPGATRPILLSRTLRVCEDRIYITALAPAE